jgi:hypothetical protein
MKTTPQFTLTPSDIAERDRMVKFWMQIPGALADCGAEKNDETGLFDIKFDYDDNGFSNTETFSFSTEEAAGDAVSYSLEAINNKKS